MSGNVDRTIFPKATTAPRKKRKISPVWIIPIVAALVAIGIAVQKIIMEGVIAIQSELNPTVLRTKLLSFLTPSDRKDDLVPLSRIQERFHIRPGKDQIPDAEPNDHNHRPGPAVF